jgi:LPXTG-motif cell wall-anchored protein
MRARSVLIALAVAAAAALPLAAVAATPADGTVTTSSRSVTWTGPSWPAGANAVPQAVAGNGAEPVCPPAAADPGSQVCDHYALTVNVPASYWKAHPGGVRVSASWPDPNNKLELAVYDAKGNFVNWALSGGRSSLVVPSASGVYDVVVAPSIVVRPTSYVGTVQIIDLPAPVSVPELGGPSAYRATPVVDDDPDHPVRNPSVQYGGAMLELAAHPVHAFGTEPTIGLDKKGTVYFNPLIHQDLPTGSASSPRIFASSDRGRSWRDIGTAETDAVHVGTNDPYLYVDPDYGRVFWLDLQSTGVSFGTNVSFTDDGGKAWTTTVATVPGVNDHQTLLAVVPPKDVPTPTLDPSFPKVVYYCANQITDVACSRSLDGGRTYERVGSPLLEQSTGCAVSTTDHLSADKDGRIYIGSSGCNVPMVGMSSDGGLTWTNTAVTTKILAAYHDVATTTDTAGNVYALFSDDANGLPYLSVSRNHGATWSTPVMVAPPDVNETAMLTLVAGDPGRVAVGMITTTVDNPGDVGRPLTYRMAVSQNALAKGPLFVSNVVTLPDLTSKIVARGSTDGMADFLDLQREVTGGGVVWGSLSVPCTSKDCQTKRYGVNNLSRGMGYAVEQAAGPALLGAARDLPGSVVPGNPPAAPAPPTAPSGSLPTTGMSAGPMSLAGLGLVLAALVLRRRRVRLG